MQNPPLSDAFRAALNFWARVIDFEWKDAGETGNCTLGLVRGTTADLDDGSLIARAQTSGDDWIDGWIAIDPKAGSFMTKAEIYATAIHELGHIFGLTHNSNPHSFMFPAADTTAMELDARDLAQLREHHKLRRGLPAIILANDLYLEGQPRLTMFRQWPRGKIKKESFLQVKR